MKHDGVVAVPAEGCFLSLTPPLPSLPVSLAFSSNFLATELSMCLFPQLVPGDLELLDEPRSPSFLLQWSRGVEDFFLLVISVAPFHNSLVITRNAMYKTSFKGLNYGDGSIS